MIAEERELQTAPPVPDLEPEQNVLCVRDTNMASPPKAKRQINIKTEDIITTSVGIIDFGESMPGNIRESELVLTLPYNLDPMVLNIRALCLNEDLNSLPEYVFGLRRGNSNEFGDELKVRIQEKIPIKLIVGVKVPSIPLPKIDGALVVEICGLKIEPLVIHLNLHIKIPKVECIRELSSEIEDRIVKIMIKKKNKKQGKVPFRNCENFKIYGETEVIGLGGNCLVQASPKNLVVNPKSQFYVTLSIKLTEAMKRQIENTAGVYKIRRILLIRVKDSSVFYHFPVEISFYENDKMDSATE